MSNLSDFLNAHRIPKGDTTTEITHTSMGKGGKFHIKKNEMGRFFELYEEEFLKGTDMHLIERHMPYGPVVIDLDFEYSPDVEERQHTEDHVEGIVRIYMEEIKEMFQLEEQDHRLTAFVFEKDAPYRKLEKEEGTAEEGVAVGGSKYKCTKDGIHIMFPYIISTPEPQYVIRDGVLKKIGTVLDGVPLNVPNAGGMKSYGSVVDRSVIQANGWFMFGSTKPGHDTYKLNYIIDVEGNFLDRDSYDFGGMSPVRFFSIRMRSELDMVAIRDEKMDAVSKFQAKEHKKKEKKRGGVMDKAEMELIRQFVQIIGDARANDYTTWMEVGWALHNISPDNQDMLDAWIEFSRRSPKYREGECETIWDQMKDEGLGVGSIRYWARMDNPEGYRRILMNDIHKMMECSIKTPTNYDIASVLHRMYRYEFKHSPSGNWYMFENHLWREIPDSQAFPLRHKISTDLCEKYCDIIQRNNLALLSGDITEEDKEDVKARNKEILSIVSKLKTTSFKDNIMKECKELFYDNDFINRLDANFYLIGFDNGVYDLKRMELREGRPDDYVSLSTGICKIEFDERSEHWASLYQFIYTVFPRDEMREYFMIMMATCVQGLNAEEKFRVWTGTGSNGKSKLEELFTACMGDYSIKFPVTLLTGKRAASNACSPELVKAKGKRFGYFVEPSEGERVNAGLMKEFTGGDKIYARGLHMDPIEFKPQFKLMLLCNDVPYFPPKDTGVWRRVEIVEFESKFTENPNPENPFEFPIDKHITEKIQDWKELFMAYLIDVYYRKYRDNGYKFEVPEQVLKFTMEFQKMFDMYSEFISTHLIDTGVPDDTVTLNEVHEEFKNWFLETYDSHKVPSKPEFRQYLEKTYGKKRITTNEIVGVKAKFKVDANKDGENPLGLEDDEDFGEEESVEEPVEEKKAPAPKAPAPKSSAPKAPVEEKKPAKKVVPEEPEKKGAVSVEPILDEFDDEFYGEYDEDEDDLGSPPTSLVGPVSKNPFGLDKPERAFPLMGGTNPFGITASAFPKMPMNTTTNYQISSLEDLKNLKIPGLEGIHLNPVIQAAFRGDTRILDELGMKQTGPGKFTLPTQTSPTEVTTVTTRDAKGNITTNTTRTTNNIIPTIQFDGLPPNHPYMQFPMPKTPPPPPRPSLTHMLAALLASAATEDDEMTDEEYMEMSRRRRARDAEDRKEFLDLLDRREADEGDNLDPEEKKFMEQMRKQAREDEENDQKEAEEQEERYRILQEKKARGEVPKREVETKEKEEGEKEEGEMEGIPLNHPLFLAFASVFRGMLQKEVEDAGRRDPSINRMMQGIFKESEEEDRFGKIIMEEETPRQAPEMMTTPKVAERQVEMTSVKIEDMEDEPKPKGKRRVVGKKQQ